MGHHAQAAGAEYERTVTSACLHYMAEMVATVAKVPTEMRAGKYATASTVDFMGYLSGGLHCAFEVKGSRSPYLDLTRPPRKKGDPRRPTLEAHQLEYLDYAALDGCRAGVLVGITVGRDTDAEEMLWWWVHPKAWVQMVESAKADPRWKNPRATQELLTQHGWKCPMIEVSGGGRAPDWLSASVATPCPKITRIATLEAQVEELAWMAKLPVKYGDAPLVHKDDGSRRPRDCDGCGDALEFEVLCIQCGAWACQHCDLGGFCDADCKYEHEREHANALEIYWELDSVGGPAFTSQVDGWNLSIMIVSRGWEIRNGGEVHNGDAQSLEDADCQLREKLIALMAAPK